MDRKSLEKKRESILKRIAKNPEAAKLIAEKAQNGIPAEQRMYIDALKQIGMVMGKIEAYFSESTQKTSENIAMLSKGFAGEIAKMEKTLKEFSDDAGARESIFELREMKSALKALASKEPPQPVVHVPAPIVEVKAPDAIVIDKTKTEVVHETEYQKKASDTLQGVLTKLSAIAEKVGGLQVARISNQSPAEAIPVVIVDKRKRGFQDFSDMHQPIPMPNGAGSGDLVYLDADGNPLRVSVQNVLPVGSPDKSVLVEVDSANPDIKYYGFSLSVNADSSEPIWKIYRVEKTSTGSIKRYAEGTDGYTLDFDSRESFTY